MDDFQEEEFSQITPKQFRALAVLLTGGTNSEAGRAAGVSELTVFNWRRRPDFSKLLRQSIGHVFGASLARIALLAETAIDELEAILCDSECSAKTKIQAISLVLNFAAKAKELEIDARLSALEEALSNVVNIEQN